LRVIEMGERTLKVMRFGTLSFIGGLMLVAANADASRFDCHKAAMPSDFVVCSNPALLEENNLLASAWFKARSGMDAAGKTELVKSQRAWLKSITSDCGLPERGRPSNDLIKKSEICILGKVQTRRKFLEGIASKQKAATLPDSGAHADQWVAFRPSNARVSSLLDRLLKVELSRSGADYQYDPDAAQSAQIAWVKISRDESPYLFAMLQGSYCGSGGCAIYGFRNVNGKWRKAYFCFGGEGLEVLDTSSNGHRDLRQDEQDGAAMETEITSVWDGQEYRVARRQVIN